MSTFNAPFSEWKLFIAGSLLTSQTYKSVSDGFVSVIKRTQTSPPLGEIFPFGAAKI